MALFVRPQSTTVRIARPNSVDDSAKPPTPRKDSVQRQCRNIVIYGHCKFQDKGCVYYHPPAEDSGLPRDPSPVARTDSPAVAALTPDAVNAPVFVPKFALPRDVTSPPPPTPPVDTTQHSQGQDSVYENNYEYQPEYSDYDYQVDQSVGDMQAMQLGYEDYHSHDMMEASYYAAAPVFLRQPLNYLLYTPTMPSELVRNPMSTHFTPTSMELRQQLQERSEAIRTVNPVDLGLPEELQGYHTLVPLELSGPDRKKFGNWHSIVYRATRTSDGMAHALRRVENFRLTQQIAFAPIEAWQQIVHPNIVAVKEAFTSRAFNDDSLIVSYAYYPNARTLFEAHIKSKPPAAPPHQQTVYYNRHQHRIQPQQSQQANQQVVPERTLWSYIVQIASAIKKVHERGMAVRMIDPTKILVTGQNRVRISSCGIFDVLLYGTPQPDITALQQDDLMKFGRLIFALCTGNLSAASNANLQKSVETMKNAYSVDVQSVALFLCSKMPKTIDVVLDMIRPKILLEHDDALMAADRLESELMGELENARLFRLMCKFGFINERPEFARDARWSETGDRYIIKLFRDYVFHQVDEHGNPILDLSHVLTCLNKLDAGTDEKLMLIARDDQSCLVVSYKDIKACVSNAFEELVRATTASQTGK